MSVVSFADFRGGYATSLSGELMDNNMCLVAENWMWEDRFQKRQGKSLYMALTGYEDVRGMHRVYMNNEWTTIYALDNSGVDVTFWRAAAATKTQIGSKTFTTGYKVRMASLNGQVVAVNGVDKPVIIYYSGAYQIQDLEQHDARTRENADWFAGQYDTSAGTYTDDTTHAQDTDTGDFAFCNTGAGDGFWISCVYTFNKVVFHQAQECASGVVTYEYYKGSGTWGTLTAVSSPVWTAAEADRTLEFNVPSDWVVYDIATAGLADKYVMRGRFTTSPGAAKSCDYLSVYNTRTITNIKNILGGKEFHLVHQHGNRIWLGNNEGVAYSPHNQTTGWYDYYVEYFAGGGNSLVALRSFGNSLLVFKAEEVWGYFGNSFENYYKQRVTDKGCIAEESPVVIGNRVMYVGNDGIYMIQNGSAVKVSKHIQSDLDGYALAGAVGAAFRGFCWMSFPASNVVLVFDPDTYRADDMGDGRVSFFKFPSYRADLIQYNYGDGDNKYLLIADNSGAVAEINRGHNGVYSDSGVSISTVMQTKYNSIGAFQRNKAYKRIKWDVEAAGDYTMTYYADDGTTIMTDVLSAGTGAGHYVEDVSLPYTLDGRNFSIKITNTTANNARIYGYSMDVAARRF